MTLRTRIAIIVGATVLLASAVAGVGISISTRNVGLDRLDESLRNDAARLLERPNQARAIQTALEIRRIACDEVDETSSADSEAPPRNTRGRDLIATLAVPDIEPQLQLMQPNGAIRSACTALPITDDDRAIGDSPVERLQTHVVDGRRVRQLTTGVEGLGTLQLARDLELTEGTLRALLTRVVAFGAIGALLAALLGWWFAGRTTRPVEDLTAAARRVTSTGDFDQRLGVARTDEIGQLASSFDSMLGSLARSQAQQQRLVQDASHELRTPLTSIKTNLDLLRRHEDAIGADARREILADIDAELAELQTLTVELVESATDVPTVVERSEPVDLVALAEDCVERARRRHRRTIGFDTSVEPARHGDAQIEHVHGDPALLARAITNLINNAAKFSSPDSPIDVSVSPVSLEVRDRGPGIDPDELPHIFERFFRATEARAAPGSGLGLSIVRQVVEGHSGSLHAANRDGGGLVIGFSLERPSATEPTGAASS